MEWLKDILPLIIAVIGGGGLFAGIVALLKVRPEAGSVAVTTTEKAVVIQASILEDLQEERKEWVEERKRLRDRMDAMEAELDAMHKLTWKVAELERENSSLKSEREMLVARVKHLETEVETLKKNGANGA